MRSVYFYTPPPETDPHHTIYQHTAIALCEGLAELGFSLYASRPYWRTSVIPDETLFKYDPHVEADDCDIVLIHSDLVYFYDGLELIRRVGRKPSQVLVYLDQHDHATYNERNLIGLFAAKFDLILAVHRSLHETLPTNVKPWAFGLAGRQIRELTNVPTFSEREWTLRLTFRPAEYKELHPVRAAAQELCYPVFETVLPTTVMAPSIPEKDAYHCLMWRQTGRRHNPAYYNDLKSAVATASFGGYFIPSWPRNRASLLFLLLWRVMRALDFRSNRISQWDNWRFWEAMGAGSVSVHVDLERYALALPVSPTNWEHYIGVDLDCPKAAVDRISADPGVLERISSKGRDWVLKHYSPVPVAKRFLKLLGHESDDIRRPSGRDQ